MLNKLLETVRRYEMLKPGDTLVCAVSGGADSMALLFAMYLLRSKLGIRLAAAHFNHGLRGAESDRDAAFVKDFCAGYDIALYEGAGTVKPGPKGIEAAAREARYAFFDTLPGKLATAHTADDNAETVLLHLVRGTGLKGLGAIAPVRRRIIRPMLLVTRAEVLAFLEEYGVQYVEDSSNETDQFLRNRLRHHVMPLLKEENPRLAENLSAMALGLREDEQALAELSTAQEPLEVDRLRALRPALRKRVLARFLEHSGVREPEAVHIALAEGLIFSEKPSAKADFPGGVTVCRRYGVLEAANGFQSFEPVILPCPGSVELPDLGLRVCCEPSEAPARTVDAFTVCPVGQMVLRSRRPGDEMRLSGGTKSLKKLFIDRKIPAARRPLIPVLADEKGVLGVYGVGVNLDRLEIGVRVQFEKVTFSESCKEI